MKRIIIPKIINAVIVAFLVFCMTQLSISSIQELIALEDNQLNQTTENDVVETTTDVVETTTTLAEEPTTEVETTTAKAEETTTVKSVPVTTEPVAEQETYIDEDMPTNIGQFTNDEVIMLCKVTYGEAGSLSKTQQAAVVWCILNRVDSVAYPNTIVKVITQKSQFYGYRESNPINPTTKEVVVDVLNRWIREKRGEDNVGRVLPQEYMYFTGNGKENIFRLSSKTSSQAWDWSLPSPYGD